MKVLRSDLARGTEMFFFVSCKYRACRVTFTVLEDLLNTLLSLPVDDHSKMCRRESPGAWYLKSERSGVDMTRTDSDIPCL